MIDDFLIFSNFVVVTADFLLARFIPLWEPLQGVPMIWVALQNLPAFFKS